MPLELRPSDLTERQRKVIALSNQGVSTRGICERTGYSWATVKSVFHEVAVKARRAGAANPSILEQIARLETAEKELAAHGRCARCGLLEPHECVHVSVGRKDEEVVW